MTLDTLRICLDRRPFEPFKIILSSGTIYEVRHPENAILMRGGLLVAYGGSNGELPDRFAHLSYLHIAAVETIPPE
ncbi:MAG: hypothetical protein HOP29_17325 [Phycisphaerales bacterium]|nr:hypothetical protein [Phycisphaerales bacterium]